MTLEIRVHRRNMEVPQGLLQAAERKLGKLEPFLDASGWVEVGFAEEHNPRRSDKYHCEIVAHVKGHRLKVDGSGGEPHAALDAAVEKAVGQVQRLKGKRMSRRRGRAARMAAHAGELSPNGDAADVLEEALAEPGPGPDSEHRAPALVTDVQVADPKPMTAEEAALQLDAQGREFLLFQDADTGRSAVVYRRGDGAFGLVRAAV